MKYAELQGKTVDELQDLLLQLKKEAFNLRVQKATGELEKTSRIREVRRDIARIQTQLHAGQEETKASPKAKKKVGDTNA